MLIFQGVCLRESKKQRKCMIISFMISLAIVHEFWIGNIKTRWWFQICFIFTPLFGEDEPILTNISKGLVQPPTRKVVCEIKKSDGVHRNSEFCIYIFWGKTRGERFYTYIPAMVAWYIYLHEWLIFKCFHVGNYTDRQPWMCLGLVLNMNRVNKFQLLSSRVKPTVFHVMFRGIEN